MPKLKPIKDEAELARVPLDEPVLVELEPAATGMVAESEGEHENAPPGGGTGGAEREQDDGSKVLKAQLEASKEAERVANERAAESDRRAKEASDEAARLRTTGADTEKELLASSLSSAQAEEAAAQAELEKAFEVGDAKAMGAAQAKIGRAAAKVVNLEGAIAQFEQDAAERERIAKETPKTEERVDIVTAIDRDPNLMPKERDWLKDHPEVLTDSRRNRELSVGYDRALAKGFKRGSEGYFKFLDEFMGFAELERPARETDDDTDNERASIVSAPVTRDNRSSLSGKQTAPTRITLTPAEREAARNMGVSDVAYAKGKLQLAANKSADPERYAGR